MGIATPPNVTEAFATSGTANTIPVASQIGITPGAASFTDGFPPLTATPIGSGGIPPSVGDMNGILKMLSAHIAFLQSGAGYQFNSTIATAIGGYNIGAVLLAADNSGYWMNLANNNSTNPDTGGANWMPIDQYGLATVAVAGVSVTLSATQYGKQVIIINGSLSASINLVFPALVAQWIVVNNATGAYTITCKTAFAPGFVVPQGGWATASTIQGDGTAIYSQAGNFVTSAGLTAALASYVTSASLAATLGSYVTQTSLTSQLGAYVLLSGLNTQLAPYATIAYLNGNFPNNASLASQLSGYLTSAVAASTYVSNSLLATTLSSYITATALATNLANYLKTSLLQNGTATCSSSGTLVTFGTPFPTVCTSVVACAVGQAATVFVLSYSRTGAVIVNGANGSTSWHATGY